MLFAASLLALSTQAGAAIFSASDSNFSWTTDTATGLDWLDFDGGAEESTVGLALNQVLNLMAGGHYAGWTYASSAQVITFVENVSGVAFNGPGVLASYDGVTNAVVAFTGSTSGADIFGITGSIHPVGAYFRVDVVNCTTGCSGADSWENRAIQLPSTAEANVGSWLFRQTTPVPLPATAFLLIPAIAGLGFLRRRAA